MPPRILSAAPLLLLLLSTDARSARVDPSMQSDFPANLNVPVKAMGLDAGHLKAKQLAAGPGFDWHHGGAPSFRALVTTFEFAKSGQLQPVLDASARHGDDAVLSHLSKPKLPFKYHDYRRFMRLELRKPGRASTSPPVVVLPLPASGSLLGTAVLGGLLLGNGRWRTSRRQRQPLRYRTV